MGLTVIFGVMKLINFAHGELVMLPMYFAYWLFALWGVDPLISLVLALPFFFLLGVLIQRMVLNRMLEAPEENQILVTVGISLLLMNTALLFWKSDYRTVNPSYASLSVDLGGSGIRVGFTRLLAFSLVLVLTVLFYQFISRTWWGKAMRATSQNRESALLVGVDVGRVYAVSFGVGAALASASGIVFCLFHPVFPTVGQSLVLRAFVVVVLGGMGSFGGALAGGLIIGLVESLTAVYVSAAYKEIFTFLIFGLTLLFRPWGLFGRRQV